MVDTQASSRYANALFGLAMQNSEIDTVERDFERLIQILETHQELSHLVLNSTISRSEIEDLIEKVLPSDISHLLLNFVKVLIRKMRFGEIHSIRKTYHRLYEAAKGIKEVRAITAAPLSERSRNELMRVLNTRLKADIRLIEETDPQMIGGLVLRFDGYEINYSYYDRLLELKQILMK